MAKKKFDITFDPRMQPGYQTRYKSLDSLMGPSIPAAPAETTTVFAEGNLRRKFKSQQVPQLLPSVQLRKKGKL